MMNKKAGFNVETIRLELRFLRAKIEYEIAELTTDPRR